MIIANYTHLGDEITALTMDNYHSLFPDLHNSAKSIFMWIPLIQDYQKMY